MSSVPSRIEGTQLAAASDVVAVMPDFPYNHAKFLADAKASSQQPFTIPQAASGKMLDRWADLKPKAL